jgi:AcrR family transcriptional regulator
MPRSPGRRSEILDAFVRYVAERGYERTNIGDIADELGMSKGTIVHHFGTKSQMLRELEETHLARQLDVLRMAWDRLAAPHERIVAIIYTSTLLHVIDRDATVASQREVVQLSDDPAMQQVQKLRDQLQALMIDEIRNGVEDGVFRSVNVELAALQLWGSLQSLWVWFDPDGPRSPEQVGAAFVADCCSTACSSASGRILPRTSSRWCGNALPRYPARTRSDRIRCAS